MRCSVELPSCDLLAHLLSHGYTNSKSSLLVFHIKWRFREIRGLTLYCISCLPCKTGEDRYKIFGSSCECVLEKAMAPHSSTLAWRIPWTEEPGRLQSMGSLRVGRDWATSLSLFTFKHWRRKWQPSPVFLPGESQGRGSLVGCRLWGRTESDTTEAT